MQTVWVPRAWVAGLRPARRAAACGRGAGLGSGPEGQSAAPRPKGARLGRKEASAPAGGDSASPGGTPSRAPQLSPPTLGLLGQAVCGGAAGWAAFRPSRCGVSP